MPPYQCNCAICQEKQEKLEPPKGDLSLDSNISTVEDHEKLINMLTDPEI